ncbi:phage/plasmid replication protein, II/X family [Methylomonas rapida]|uniref:Phage/plasmid replication protein, II/X family n=1 Tax=Methylomonas rapida TaxID=2963939 RepID=A0ABY7GCI4_9GAMM|nr:phage/plasmid replication protein, II/X family [Methylomonas rapida]WAR42982.1 phage/plasmid replication protein, II/X family [Methylomonas rapida]WAR42995.1 phage/plasmid replication protein, II/X family [Methylomonas rapida]
MIDMLVLRCPFRQVFESGLTENGLPVLHEVQKTRISLSDLKIPLESSLDAHGEEIALTHRWESIPSSLSTMAFKVFDFRDSFKKNADVQDFFIEIKASPAKLIQGHNLFGSDNIWYCAEKMIHLLIDTYPHLIEYLEQKHWSVEQVDITYHSWCKTENEALQFVNALQNVSNGQTRARTGYAGTAYFGKSNSRIKKIKVYVKLLEVMNQLAKLKKRGDKVSEHYTDALLDWAKGMVRWEVSLKTRWFERRQIDNNLFSLSRVFNAEKYWKEATQDLFKALEGKQMRIIRDEEIEKALKAKFPTVNARSGKITYGKAMSAYRVFRSIKADGWIEARRTATSENVFWGAIEMLHEVGLSRAVLQNLKGDGLQCEVIPFIRYVEINFGEQFPPFYKAA